MKAVERFTKAKQLSEDILRLARELDELDEFANEYNLVFGAVEARDNYSFLIDDATKNPDFYEDE